MERSILKVIDEADEEGNYSFIVKKFAVRADVAAMGPNILRELLRAHFCTFTNCTLKTGRTRRWTDGLDATACVNEFGDWTVQLNLAKFFRLPALHPRAELTELRGFFDAMKPFFEQHASSRAVVDFFSHRVKGSVSGALECRYPVVLGLATTVDQDHTGRLRALVDGSQVLQSFLNNVSHSINTVGPWEFGYVHETMLYGLVDGPAMRQYLEEQRKGSRSFFDMPPEAESLAA
jgi:hypothetical protein